MNTYKRHAVVLGVAIALCAMPALAQFENGVTFDAPFAFHAGEASMPAGTYRVSQPDSNLAVLQIQDADGSHTAFVQFRAVDKQTAPSETEVGFKTYGEVDFLNRISIAGENTVLVVSQSNAEEDAAITAFAEEHSIPATRGMTMPAAASNAQPINGSN
jgi:hypothetical protein